LGHQTWSRGVKQLPPKFPQSKPVFQAGSLSFWPGITPRGVFSKVPGGVGPIHYLPSRGGSTTLHWGSQSILGDFNTVFRHLDIFGPFQLIIRTGVKPPKLGPDIEHNLWWGTHIRGGVLPYLLGGATRIMGSSRRGPSLPRGHQNKPWGTPHLLQSTTKTRDE